MNTRVLGAFSLVLILSLSSLFISSVNAGSIFSDGFESGDFSAWSSTVGAATVQSGIKHHGTYAAEFEGLDIAWCLVTFAEQSSCNARWYVQFSSLPTSNNYVIIGALETTSGNWLSVLVKNNTAGTLQWGFEEAGGWNYINATINTGVWYAVEIEFRSSGTSKLYIDGSSLDSFSDSARNVKSFRIGQYNQVDSLTSYDDCVVIDSSYIGPEPTDIAPPTFSSISTNTTFAGQPCSFNCLVGDDTNVSSYIFSTNNTGMWINDTAVVFSTFFNESAAWANVTKTLNGAVDNVISYLWYANDTSNNQGSSDQYNLSLSELQHYLAVISPYGLSGGQGWYGDGSTAYASLDTGIVDQGNGTRRVFTNWSGDASGTSFSQSDPVTMDGNKTAIAVWKTQYYITFTHSGLDPSGFGEVVTVNGTTVNYDQLPYSLWADSGIIITYSYDNVASTTLGERFILTGVSGSSSPITVTEPAIITGDYGTQYEVTFDQTGVGTDFNGTVATIDAVAYSRGALPVSFWWDKDSNHNFSFNSQLLVNSSRQYEWNTTSGLSTLQSETLAITAPGSIIGNYVIVNGITFDQIGVNPDFAGAVLEVDGNAYTAAMLPVSFVWEAGSVHSFTFFSPLVVNSNSKRYVWTSTTGLSEQQSDTITITTYGSIIANYKTQYFLTVTSSYGTENGGGWYDNGAIAYAGLDTGTIDNGNGTRQVFVSWTGDASGSSYLQSNPILMNGLKNAEANWKSQCLLEVFTAPIGLIPQPTRDPVGQSGSLGWWYDVSTNVNLTALNIPYDVFENWRIDGINRTTGVNSVVVVTDAPHVATAYYLSPDVAVTSVIPSKTVVGQGYSASMNVTVMDLGFSAEILNVTLYANNSSVENQTVILAPGWSLVMHFSWNTSGFAYGNYTISAYVWSVQGEVYVTNNNSTANVQIHVGIPGDVSSSTPGVYDKVVNMKDIAYMIALFNTKPSSPNWNPNADVNNDGVVNMKDIATAIFNFNQHE